MSTSKAWGIEFKGFPDVLEQLRKLEADIQGITEKALVETQAYIAKQADKLTEDEMLPAKGEYRGDPSETKEAIIRDTEEFPVKWEGEIASIAAGFVHGNTLNPIFLMYGTPRMEPVPDLEDAIKGKTAKKAVAKIQKDIFINAVKEAEK
ncbi:MAG: hypothetical protein UD936_02465 [Acutalibacteraceae bacterium]|nr:hypothetical protein [Acutalibacteraceae bacterium]